MNPISPSPEAVEPSAMPEGVYARSVKSVWWYGMGLAAQKGLSLIGFLVLIRLLQPEDYGALTAIFVVTGLFDQFTTIPFGDALVQRKADMERFLDPMWTWDLLRSILLAAVIFILQAPIAQYFGLNGNAQTLIAISGIFFIVLPALGNPRQLYFFRHLDLRRVFIRDVVAQSAYVLVAAGYAIFVEPSVVALFAGHVARFVFGVTMSYVLYPAWPRISFAFRRLWELVWFGKWAYGHGVVEWIAGQADRIVVGGLMGVGLLGLYTRARDLSLTASGVLANAFDKVGMPAFARVQDDRKKLQRGFLKSLDLFVMTCVPFSLALLVEGGTAVPLILGEQWIGIVLPLKIFAVGALASGLTYILQPFFTGIGRPDVAFKLRLLQAIVTVPLLYFFGAARGPIGLAAAVTTGWFVTLLFGMWWARPLLRFDKRDVAPLVTSTTVAALAMIAADSLGRHNIHAMSLWFVNIVWIGALGLIYLAVLFLMSHRIGHGPFETFYSIIQKPLDRVRRYFRRPTRVDNAA